MTEEEAKTKWCPMVRFNYTGNGNTDHNRGAYVNASPTPINCIASDCMMWVWQIPPNVAVSDSDTGANREGHCGLAGKP